MHWCCWEKIDVGHSYDFNTAEVPKRQVWGHLHDIWAPIGFLHSVAGLEAL